MHIQDTLRHYAQVIRGHFRFILLGVIFGSSITFVISLFLPSVYQASALIKVDSVLTTAATASDNDVFSTQAQAVSYAILVTSPEVLQEAAKKLPGMTVDQLKNVVSDSPVDNTQLIEVRASADNPKQAADIANTVAATFVQFQEAQEKTRLQNAADELSQNLTQAKINIDTAQQQLTTLQNTHAAEDSIAQQQSQLATYQSTYNAFLSSNGQLQTQEQQVASMLSVTQLALPPDKPTSPQIALNTVLAVCMSLLLMIVLVLLQDWLDVTIKTVDDIVQLAELEPLGSIPLGTSTTQLFDLRSEYTDEVKDAYSMLGAPFRMLSRGERAILVTSPRSGSGTTASATYLALSLAKVGMRVLLIDANVRCPSLHDIFLRPDTHGLVESLQNMQAFQASSTPLSHLWLNQWQTDIPNLWLLPAGPLGPYPSSLLHEPTLGLFLDRLLGRTPDASEQLQPRLVDMIIFDTAALEQGTTDAYLLATIADATVLVVEAGKEHKDTLQRLSVTFQQFGAPILGVIVNRQQKQHRSYFYAPRRVPVGRKVVVPPSFDQAPLLPLLQENSGSTPEQTLSQEKEQLFVKETLPLQSALDGKIASDSCEIEIVHGKDVGSSAEIETAQPQFKLKRVQSQQGLLPLQPSAPGERVHTQPLVGFKLPETPAPLPLVYSDIAVNMSTDQADEAQDDAPGMSQFAPLLRLSRTMSQRRDDVKNPEV